MYTEYFIEIEELITRWDIMYSKVPYTLRNTTYKHATSGNLLCVANGTYRQLHTLTVL